MANERAPSIFNDRGFIGSEKDLDEYGIWVKSESEEFSAPAEGDSFEADFPSFDEGHSSTDATGHISGTATHANADVTLSAALLLKIAEELALIKAELSSLKSELDYIHRGESRPAARTSVDSTPPKPVASDLPSEAEIPESKAEESIPTETVVEDEVVDEAVFDDFRDFGIEESADEELEGESIGREEGEESAHDKTAGTFFSDTDDSDKITLTTDELDLLSEPADETLEEMEDSFFAEDSDEEKIAFTGDEISNILDSTEIHDEKGDAEGLKEAVQETAQNAAQEAVDDEKSVSQTRVETDESSDFIQEESLTEPEAAQNDAAQDAAEEPLIEDDVFDINIETAEEPLSEDSLSTEDEDAEITLDEEPFDIEIEDESPEEEPETTGLTDDLDIETATDTDTEEHEPIEPVPETAAVTAGDDFDIKVGTEEPEITGLTDDLDIETATDTDTEEHEPIEPIPETADIAFDPFGSLPDEDILEESVAGLEEDSPVDFTAGEPLVEDDPFADFPVQEEPLAEEKTGPPADESVEAEESAEGAKTAFESADAFADLPPLEDETFDESLTVDETKTEETVLPDETFNETFFDEETVETDETPEALPDGTSEDSFDLGKDEDSVVEADPELMEILDEDIRQMSPPPDDTSYLDDENPLEFDEFTEMEPPAPIEPALQEAIAPLPEEKPDTPEAVPQGAESPALKGVPVAFKQELRTVLSYMDILLESLPEEKIEEFARSEHFEPYKKLFKELGLV